MIDSKHWVHNPQVRGAIEDGAPAFFLQADEFKTNWVHILENHNQCVSRYERDGFQHNRYLDSTIISHGIVHPELDYYNKVGEALKDIYNYDSVTVHSYSSFTVDATVYDYHQDSVDVVVLGLIGLTEFTVDEKKYDIINGNVLFIPKGVMHGATPRMPRSIISIGLSRGV